MHFSGIVVGAAVFFSIGICHPTVIKMEYHLGKKSWWVWLVMGLICCVVSSPPMRFDKENREYNIYCSLL